jgi:trans-2,3-dihydro-3-hydroxyanthranilate isomerase
MMKSSYSLVDVFTTERFGGNPLAVFKEADNISGELMQRIASELNLSETTFVLKPNNKNNTIKLRIFTPKEELPMAGHPTIGTAYILIKEGIIEVSEGKNEFTFEEGVGDIRVKAIVENGEVKTITMEQPIPLFGPIYKDYGLIAELLSLKTSDIDQRYPIQTISSGVPFFYIPIRGLDAIGRIRFNSDVWSRHFSINLDTRHIFVFTQEVVNKHSTVHSRMFAPGLGIAEDPATGGAGGPLGAYLVEHGLINSKSGNETLIRSEQGIEMGRPSFIDITVKRDREIKRVEVGGNCVKIGIGEMWF